MSYESRKGYRAEVAVQQILAELVPHCYRPRAGAMHDIGDIGGLPLVVSIKDHVQLQLAGWVEDLTGMVDHAGYTTGVVWHKRRGRANPVDWYVTTSGWLVLPLLRAYLEQQARRGVGPD